MSSWRLFAVDAPEEDERWLEEFKKWKAMRLARREELAHHEPIAQIPDNCLPAAAGDD